MNKYTLMGCAAVVILLAAAYYFSGSLMGSIVIVLAILLASLLCARWYLHIESDKEHLKRTHDIPPAKESEEIRAPPAAEPKPVKKDAGKVSAAKGGLWKELFNLFLIGLVIWGLVWVQMKWDVWGGLKGMVGIREQQTEQVATTTVTKTETLPAPTVPVEKSAESRPPAVCTEPSVNHTITKTEMEWIWVPPGCGVNFDMTLEEMQSTFDWLCKDNNGNNHRWKAGESCVYLGVQLKQDALDQTRVLLARMGNSQI